LELDSPIPLKGPTLTLALNLLSVTVPEISSLNQFKQLRSTSNVIQTVLCVVLTYKPVWRVTSIKFRPWLLACLVPLVLLHVLRVCSWTATTNARTVQLSAKNVQFQLLCVPSAILLQKILLLTLFLCLALVNVPLEPTKIYKIPCA
jgi:hypothetical protein